MDVKAVIALALAGAATVVVIISLATDYWVEESSSQAGLWKLCGEGTCLDLLDFDEQLPDWYKGVQAAACLAMITNLAGTVTLALFTFVSSISPKITKLSSVALLGLAAFWNCIAVMVFAAEYDSFYPGADLSWSWGIGILAIILEIAAVVLTLLASRDD